MKVLGYAIVNAEGRLFAGYQQPRTHKSGFPVWVEQLTNANFDGKRAAIYEDLKTAADIALSIFMRDSVRCGAKAIGMED